MIPTIGEILSFLALLVAGGIAVLGKVVEKRTPSAEKELDQQDQWLKELWEINRTLSADLAVSEKNLKETRRLQETTEEECELLKRQNTQLQTAQAAWLIEREEMRAQIKGLQQQVYDLNVEMNDIKRKQAEHNGGLK